MQERLVTVFNHIRRLHREPGRLRQCLALLTSEETIKLKDMLMKMGSDCMQSDIDDDCKTRYVPHENDFKDEETATSIDHEAKVSVKEQQSALVAAWKKDSSEVMHSSAICNSN